MNILFLTLLDFSTIYESGIYTDLMREFVKRGHKVYIISPVEQRMQQTTRYLDNGNHKILKLQIGNTQKTNIIEKGFSLISLEYKFKNGIKKYFSNVKFDLVIYSTPPITLYKAVSFVKRRDNAKTYLLLKDIFPQNAVDLNMMKTTGITSIVYKFFRYKEKRIYLLSDYIGCMSQANVNYLVKNNPDIRSKIIEVCPNSIEPNKHMGNHEQIKDLWEKYNIPSDRVVFLYGGNLGKPQGIDFIIECLKENKDNINVHFIIIGSGTEFNKLKKHIEISKQENVLLLSQIPKKLYNIFVNACDVGLIFLDRQFTIPNIPSRILSYMEASKPVLAATDVNTDLRYIIEKGKFGFWCESSDVFQFNLLIKKLSEKKMREQLGVNSRKFLEGNFTSEISYEIIMKHFTTIRTPCIDTQKCKI